MIHERGSTILINTHRTTSKACRQTSYKRTAPKGDGQLQFITHQVPRAQEVSYLLLLISNSDIMAERNLVLIPPPPQRLFQLLGHYVLVRIREGTLKFNFVRISNSIEYTYNYLLYYYCEIAFKPVNLDILNSAI